MTSHNDPTYVMSWAPSAFSLKNAKQAHVLHHAHTLLSHYAVIVMPGVIENSLIGIGRQWVRNYNLIKYFFTNIHLKCIKNVVRAVINDNNNFASSTFQSLCEFVGDCFGQRYFSEGAYTGKICHSGYLWHVTPHGHSSICHHGERRMSRPLYTVANKSQTKAR